MIILSTDCHHNTVARRFVPWPACAIGATNPEMGSCSRCARLKQNISKCNGVVALVRKPCLSRPRLESGDDESLSQSEVRMQPVGGESEVRSRRWCESELKPSAPHLEASDIRACGGFYFVCYHSKHRNAKQYNCGCNYLFRGRNESCTQNRIVPFRKINLTIYFNSPNRVETPMCLTPTLTRAANPERL